MDGSRAPAGFTYVCRVDELPPLGARVISRSAVDVAVFRGYGDLVFALDDRCPHRGGPLSQGIVFGDRVACPLHGMTIGLADGCAVAPDEGCVRRHRVRVEEGCVFVALDEG